MYTLLRLKQKTNRDQLKSPGSSARCRVAAWMGGGLGENGHMCVCMAESLRHPPETITTLFVNRLYFSMK